MKNPYDVARAELGVAETPGSGSTDRILEYASEAGFDTYKNDATPWCALFANWALQSAGHPQTHSLLARSFLGYGKKLAKPKKGCIVVLQRDNDPAKGHVGFFDHEANGKVYLLGGNQGDKVSIAAFPKASVLGYREPSQTVKVSRTTLTTTATSAGAGVAVVATDPATVSAVSNTVSAIPAVPDHVTEAVTNISAWQSLADTFGGFKTWAVSEPYWALFFALLAALVALWPRLFPAPSPEPVQSD